MNWYKKIQANGNIQILSYEEGCLRAIVNGEDCYFENVSDEDFEQLRTYLKFWRQNKALELLMRLKNNELV